MNKKTISKSIILKYGTLLGSISIAISIYLYLFDKHLEQNQTVGILNILLILTAVILGIRTFTKIETLNFGDGIKIGIGITVLSAVMITVYNYIFSTYIEPDFVDQLAEVQEKEWKLQEN